MVDNGRSGELPSGVGGLVTSTEVWVPIVVLMAYVSAGAWFAIALRRSGKQVPTLYRWMWLLGALAMLVPIVRAVVAALD